MELTRAGELLRNSALTFKHDEIYLSRMLQDTAKNTRNFAFGATLSVAEFMLPPDLKRLICAYPQSHIRMEVANTRELLSKLDAGKLDFAVVEGEFPREEYEFLLYRKEPYIPVASRKKAEQYRNAEFRELLSERLILREPGSGTREILEQELRRRGMTTDDFLQITELGNIGAIQAMLRADLGISFFYQATLTERETQLVPIALKDFSLEHEVMFIFRKNSSFRKDYEEIYAFLTNRSLRREKRMI